MSPDKFTQLESGNKGHKMSCMCVCGQFDCLDECLVCSSVYLRVFRIGMRFVMHEGFWDADVLAFFRFNNETKFNL